MENMNRLAQIWHISSTATVFFKPQTKKKMFLFIQKDSQCTKQKYLHVHLRMFTDVNLDMSSEYDCWEVMTAVYTWLRALAQL